MGRRAEIMKLCTGAHRAASVSRAKIHLTNCCWFEGFWIVACFYRTVSYSTCYRYSNAFAYRLLLLRFHWHVSLSTFHTSMFDCFWSWCICVDTLLKNYFFLINKLLWEVHKWLFSHLNVKIIPIELKCGFLTIVK